MAKIGVGGPFYGTSAMKISARVFAIVLAFTAIWFVCACKLAHNYQRIVPQYEITRPDQSLGPRSMYDLELSVGAQSVKLFTVSVRGCVARMLIDDKPFSEFNPACNLQWKLFNLEFLTPGVHHLQFFAEPQTKITQLMVMPSIVAASIYWLRCKALGLTFLISLAAVFFCTRGSLRTYAALYFLPFALTLLLWQLLNVPLWERSHDLSGHVKYIRYVLHYWTYPPYNLDWETFQPPLYYFLTAGWFDALTALGFEHLPHEYLFVSLSFVLLAFARILELSLVAHLFSRRPLTQGIAALLISTLPGLVGPASLISNDTLAYVLMVALLAVCVAWHESPSWRGIFFLGLLCAAAILTKGSVLPLIPAVLLVILGQSKWTRADRVKGVAAVGALIIVFASWYPIERIAEGQTHLVGNIEINPKRYIVDNAPENFLTFNPVAIVAHPFNEVGHPWERRGYFWEFLYRSMLFGVYSFALPDQLPNALALSGFIAVGLALFGAVRCIVKRESNLYIPLLFAVSLLGGLLMIRILNPIDGFSGFRYVPLCGTVLAIFAGYAAAELRPLSRGCMLSLLLVHAAIATTMILYW